MALTTLLAHLAGDDSDAALLSAATRLAARHAAHLTGLHVNPPIELYYTAEMAMPADFTRRLDAEREALDKRLESEFDAACEAAGDFVAEWRRPAVVSHTVEHTVTEIGNTADLLLLGRPAEPQRRDARDLAARILERSARPVILIPGDHGETSVGSRILLAWDGSREATLAAFGALPLLRAADEVRLHRINQPWQDRHHVGGIAGEFANTLARHGVGVEVQHSDARASEVGEEILGFAGDMDADLVVAGCFGHGRLRELLLGGTTRHLMREARMPLLLQG